MFGQWLKFYKQNNLVVDTSIESIGAYVAMTVLAKKVVYTTLKTGMPFSPKSLIVHCSEKLYSTPLPDESASVFRSIQDSMLLP